MIALITGAVFGQNYPNKPIRIVTSEPGSANDFGARLVAQGISGALGQPVIVDARLILRGDVVARASPDGYTLLSAGTSVWLAPLLRDDVPYDPVKDFLPITWTTLSPNILVVHPSLPAKSVNELIALAKAKPGELNYVGGSTGSTAHLSAELFKAMAGVNLVRVPFKGTASGLNALMGGEVQLMFSTATAGSPHVKSGRLRGLAVTSPRPSMLFPGLPTVAESGVPGYESLQILGILAPAKTPATLVNLLNQEIVRFLKTAEAKERFFAAGSETVGSSPQQFAAKIKSEMAMWGKVIKAVGIRE